MILEVCANSYESALAAEKAGAHRIELCAELSVGGLTPSYGLIKKVLSNLNIPTYVLIRPRSGNFTYSKSEVAVMLTDIAKCKKLGVSGIVGGALTIDQKIDQTITKQLLMASEGMDFTFHRAFDWTPNPKIALQTLRALGVKRILSSGQEPSALVGISLLKELKTLSEGSLEIMPGGGVNVSNIQTFKEAGFKEFHASASEKIQSLKIAPKIRINNTTEEGVITVSSEEKIRELLKKLA